MMNRRLIALLSGLIGLLWLLPLHAAPVYVEPGAVVHTTAHAAVAV